MTTESISDAQQVLSGQSFRSGHGNSKTVKVSILGKEMQIGCSAENEPDLERAARYVERNMKESRDRNKTLSVEKIAIVTAINIANDLLKSDGDSSNNEGVAKKLQSLNAKLDTLLDV